MNKYYFRNFEGYEVKDIIVMAEDFNEANRNVKSIAKSVGWLNELFVLYKVEELL